MIQLIVPAQIVPAPKSTPGKHRVHKGETCPDTNRIVGSTPAQFRAKAILRRLDWDLEPRTRRTR